MAKKWDRPFFSKGGVAGSKGNERKLLGITSGLGLPAQKVTAADGSRYKVKMSGLFPKVKVSPATTVDVPPVPILTTYTVFFNASITRPSQASSTIHIWFDDDITGGVRMLTSADNGFSWSSSFDSLASDEVETDSIMADPDATLAMSTSAPTIFKRDGATWSSVFTDGSGDHDRCSIYRGSSNRIHALYGSNNIKRHAYSDDNGTTWSTPTSIVSKTAIGGISSGDGFIDDAGVLHAYCAQGVGATTEVWYVRSTDNGVTWSTPVDLGTVDTGYRSLVQSGSGVFQQDSAGRLYLIGGLSFSFDVHIGYSDDNGVTWNTPVTDSFTFPPYGFNYHYGAFFRHPINGNIYGYHGFENSGAADMVLSKFDVASGITIIESVPDPDPARALFPVDVYPLSDGTVDMVAIDDNTYKIYYFRKTLP